MIPPKYSFYVGENIKGMAFRSDKYIDKTTGQYADGENIYASTKINVEGRKIYIDYRPDTNSNNYFCKYDKDNKYIGYENIKAPVLIAPDNVKYIVIVLNGANAGASDTINSNFIYNMKSVNPHYKNLSKKYAKESGQEFFRETLDGKINLFGKDYEVVANSDLESRLLFLIRKYNRKSDKYIEYYKGEFNKTDCKLDYSKKKCELKTTAVDVYNEIMNKYDDTYDLIKLAPEISKINLHKRPLMQVYVRGASTITNFFGGIYWESDVDDAIDSDSALKNDYHFAYVKAGNEFYIRSAGIQDVNGVYAGTDGYWTQWNGYTCYMDENNSDKRSYMYIKRNSDNTILYKSANRQVFGDVDNRYISGEGILMVNVNDSSDNFVLDNVFVYHIYMRLLCDVDTITDSEGAKSTYKLPLDDFVSDNRNYKKCIGLNGGMFFCTSRAVDEPTKYGMNDYGQYFTNQFIPSSSGIGRALPISRNSWANASLWYVYDSFYEIFEEKSRKQYTIRDTYSIGAAIKALLKKIDPTILHEPTAEYSQFLYGDTNPLGVTRFYVYMTQKTNVLKGNYDQAAQKAEISLEGLMKMLRDCFRCYWYIEDNKLKIEHIRFFMNGGSYKSQSTYQLDFTKLTDLFNGKLSSYFQSEVEFDKSGLNRRYEFSWMDDATDLFDNVAIDVKSQYIQKDKTEEISIGQFSSDVDFMLFNPDNFSKDGFALLCPIKKDNTLEIPIVTVENLIDEDGNTYKAVVQNWYASWIYLQNFYMYDIPAMDIESNVTGGLYARSIKKCMKHTIEFPSEEDLDALKLIKTSLGNGKIDGMSFDINTRQAKVNLLYEPE